MITITFSWWAAIFVVLTILSVALSVVVYNYLDDFFIRLELGTLTSEDENLLERVEEMVDEANLQLGQQLIDIPTYLKLSAYSLMIPYVNLVFVVVGYIPTLFSKKKDETPDD